MDALANVVAHMKESRENKTAMRMYLNESIACNIEGVKWVQDYPNLAEVGNTAVAEIKKLLSTNFTIDQVDNVVKLLAGYMNKTMSETFGNPSGC